MTLLPPDPFDDVELDEFGDTLVSAGSGPVPFRHVRLPQRLKLEPPLRKLEPLGSRPLVYMPLASTIDVAPYTTLELQQSPQCTIGPPYYLGISDPSEWEVQRLMFGNEVPAMSPGGMKADLFLSRVGWAWPDGLVPIDGPILTPAHMLYLNVRNASLFDKRLSGGLWGTRVHDSPWAPAFPPGGAHAKLERVALDTITAERRAELERERLALLEPFEDGDSWETPTWEE